MADKRCSIVDILIPSLINAVERLVSPTFSAIAGIKTVSSISVLIKVIPLLISAGINSIVIFLPVWRPIPTALMGFLSVLCFSMLFNI